jgi:hypothetical protein
MHSYVEHMWWCVLVDDVLPPMLFGSLTWMC